MLERDERLPVTVLPPRDVEKLGRPSDHAIRGVRIGSGDGVGCEADEQRRGCAWTLGESAFIGGSGSIATCSELEVCRRTGSIGDPGERSGGKASKTCRRAYPFGALTAVFDVG